MPFKAGVTWDQITSTPLGPAPDIAILAHWSQVANSRGESEGQLGGRDGEMFQEHPKLKYKATLPIHSFSFQRRY